MQMDEKFMKAALAEAQQALAGGEFPVGCVIAGPEGIIAAGGRQSSRGPGANEIDHAEITAIKRLYSRGGPAEKQDLTLYSTMEPCLMCFGAALIAGIRRIVYAYEDVMGGAASCNLESLPPLYRNAEPEVVSHVLRKQSLELFYRFFSDNRNTYLQGTLLAEYTLCLK
ncbi:MAG: nucleoside deaminase [Desulfosalsimonas sp.]